MYESNAIYLSFLQNRKTKKQAITSGFQLHVVLKSWIVEGMVKLNEVLALKPPFPSYSLTAKIISN